MTINNMKTYLCSSKACYWTCTRGSVCPLQLRSDGFAEVVSAGRQVCPLAA